MNHLAPAEFISRCLDAADRTLRQELPGPLATSSIEVAGMTLQMLPSPLSFKCNGFTFNIEILSAHEMMIISATMSEDHQLHEASLVYSKLNGSMIDHWLSSDVMSEDTTILFRLMTTDRFQLTATI